MFLTLFKYMLLALKYIVNKKYKICYNMNEILIRGCIEMEFLKKHELWLLIINVILFLAITSVESK